MSLPLPQRDRLQTLLDDAFAGALVEAHRQELNALLLGNEDAQRFYLDYMGLHVALNYYGALAPSDAASSAAAIPELAAATAPDVQASAEETAEEAAAEDESLAALAISLQIPVTAPGWEAPAGPAPVFGFLGPVSGAFAAKTMGAILLVATIFYGTFIGISWNMRDAKVQDVAERERAAQGRAIPERGIAQITQADDAQWLADNQTSPIEAGRQFDLRTGEVHLNLKQGASVIVQGPAEWTIQDDNRIRLHRGMLLAKVPTAAIGFTVETPTAEIVDLGTEFTVIVGAASETQVQVQRGRVDVALLETAATGLPAAQPSIRLAASEWLHLSARGEIERASPGLSLGTGKPLAEALPWGGLKPAPEPRALPLEMPDSSAEPLPLQLTNGDFEAARLERGRSARMVQGWFESSTTDLGREWVARPFEPIRQNATALCGLNRGYIYQQIGTYLPNSVLAFSGTAYQNPQEPLGSLQVSLYVGRIVCRNGERLVEAGATLIETAIVSPAELAGDRFTCSFTLKNNCPLNIPLWLEIATAGKSNATVFLDNLSVKVVPLTARSLSEN